tara:strand:+ start:86498 stop:87385 length:888 start_codon:yes stop_codon:yes gene_type:complete
MISGLGPYETLLKIDIVDFHEFVELNHFRIRKLTVQEQCNLFDLESFDVDQNKEVKNWKPKPPERKQNQLKHLDGYSREDWEELIGSEYYLICDELEDIDLILDAFRLFKLGYIVATFSKSRNYDAVQFHYPRFVKIARAGLCKITVEELKEVQNLFIELKRTSDDKIILNLERFKNGPEHNYHSFINLVGILESLLTGDDRDTLTFRFALYLNHILKNTIKSNLSIDMAKAKRLYGIRSDLAHSGKSKKFTKEDYLLLRNITQEILVWYVQNPKYNVEESILNSLSIIETEKNT